MTRSLEQRWTALAVGTLNFLVLLLALNALLWAMYSLHDHLTAKPVNWGDPHGLPRMTKDRDWVSLQWVDQAAYDGVDPARVEKVLDEAGRFEQAGFGFEPWVHFTNRPFAGSTLNFEGDEPAFRHRRSVRSEPVVAGPPRHLSVYLFGGSTAFGVYTADEWTVGSYLWDALQRKANAEVPGTTIDLTNYGRPYYYSSQELAFLTDLLRTGHHPDMVIFLDGLNDCLMPMWETIPDAPQFSTHTAELMDQAQYGKGWLEDFGWIPMVRLAYSVRSRLAHEVPPPARRPPISGSDVLSLYAQNQKMVQALCAAYHIQCYFYWQPVPFYHYDSTLHRRWIQLSGPMPELFTQAYQGVKTQCPETIFLGDTLQDYGHRKVFVDNFHYNPSFSRFLADRMVEKATLPSR